MLGQFKWYREKVKGAWYLTRTKTLHDPILRWTQNPEYGEEIINSEVYPHA